jgi:predicted MFS family arabinose efflux permease
MNLKRFSGIPRELKLFILAFFAMGIATSIIDSTFNNFLNERFALGSVERSFLEFPRELPGMSVAFVSALLWFLCSRRLGALAMVFGVAGTLLMGFASPTYGFMVLWLFIYSLGQHIFLPLSSSIGMELAREGKAGQRLGQLNAARNFAAILGSFLVFAGFRFFGFTFHHTFALSAAAFSLAALFLFLMKPDRTQHRSLHLKLHREYGLYYTLSVLYGSRKQLFLTFAPWVLVTVFHQPTQTIATLLTLGGVIGIVFQPLLGWAIDRLGERFVLASEAVLLVFVCTGYGFARFLFAEHTAFLIACACFLLDQMLMSVNMARSTYMKKIALEPAHVQPTLTLSVSIDHVFSIAVALLGGLVWKLFGFQYVFLMGTGIAFLSFLAALRVRVPEPSAARSEMPPALAQGKG